MTASHSLLTLKFFTNKVNTNVSKSIRSYLLEAEKYLFSLKEILVQESMTQIELINSVFWGLVACQLVQNKDRETFENTSLKKLKELVEREPFSI